METVENMFKDSLAKFFKVDSLLNNLTGYLETRVELFKIEIKEDLANGLSRVILYFLMAFMFALCIGFLSIAVALILSARLGSFAGFSIVSAFYLLAGIILLLSREKLISKMEKRFTSIFSKKK